MDKENYDLAKVRALSGMDNDGIDKVSDFPEEVKPYKAAYNNHT
jgi:hypothetical protein